VQSTMLAARVYLSTDSPRHAPTGRPRRQRGGMTANPRLIRTAELRDEYWSRRAIHAAVADGRLVRLRPGAFVVAGVEPDCIDAGRARGRLTGPTELARRGVFVLEQGPLHIHVPSTASRFTPPSRPHRIHRRALLRTPHPNALVVEPLDALLDAVLAQSPRAALASIDSALHLGVVRMDDLDELFAALPRRYRRLRRLVDPRAESGAESLFRLILRAIGCDYDCQVEIPGVGRVDFLVGGWLIIECDSRAHHADWAAQRNDRRRDLAAAQRGLVTLRVIAEDVFWRADEVAAAVRGLLRARGRAAYMLG